MDTGANGVNGELVLSTGTSRSGNSGSSYIGTGSSTGGRAGSVYVTVGSGDTGVDGELVLSAGQSLSSTGRRLSLLSGAGVSGSLNADVEATMFKGATPQDKPPVSMSPPKDAQKTPPTPPSPQPEPSSSRPSPTVAFSDLSALPNLLQNHFDQHGSGESVRPGIIRAGSVWKRQRQENLFSVSQESQLESEKQRMETQRAFDLLDALTRSGGLTVEGATVHVVLASSHYFPQSLLETVIQRNMNPLLKLEESTLLMASVIHGRPMEELVA
jgi:hypothetical protein